MSESINSDLIISKIREFAESIGYKLDPRTAQGYRIGNPIHFEGEFYNISAGYGRPHGASLTSNGAEKYSFTIRVCAGRGFGGLLISSRETTNKKPFIGEIPAADFVSECCAILTETKKTAEAISREFLNRQSERIRELYTGSKSPMPAPV